MEGESGQAGFTLVEMLVVLALLALVAAASGYALAGGRPARLVAATADQLAADLTRTRIDAIRIGRPRGLYFDIGSRSWQRDGAAPVRLADGVVLDLTTAREAARRDAGNGTSAIAFMPDGRSTGGRIEIRMEGARQILEVNWLTGTLHRVVR